MYFQVFSNNIQYGPSYAMSYQKRSTADKSAVKYTGEFILLFVHVMFRVRCHVTERDILKVVDTYYTMWLCSSKRLLFCLNYCYRP